MIIYKIPIKIKIAKTSKAKRQYFRLNMNEYRNTHYQVLNKAKLLFKKYVKKVYSTNHLNSPITIEYTLFHKTNRKFDQNNIYSIADKFFCDYLVDTHIIIDDNYHYIGLTKFNKPVICNQLKEDFIIVKIY